MGYFGELFAMERRYSYQLRQTIDNDVINPIFAEN